ncbi:MAG: non-canonical purine NTP pyrophosphatase [Patescibacteria group bacterium]
MKPLLIATKNNAKAEDYKHILSGFGVQAISLSDIGDGDDVEETGKTLEENAILKAVYFSKKHSCLTISDDSGFEIDALGGEPGIYARRWPGYEATDEELINLVKTKLIGVPAEKRTAKFTNKTALSDVNGDIVTIGTGYIAGYIPLKVSEKRWPGFPYRSCLFVPQFNKFWGEMTDEEFRQINFRHKAIEKMLPQINKLINLSFPTSA